MSFKRRGAAGATPLLSLNGRAHGCRSGYTVNHPICFRKSNRFVSVDTLGFSMEKKFSAMALPYGFLFPDIGGAMPYVAIRLKYAWEVY